MVLANTYSGLVDFSGLPRGLIVLAGMAILILGSAPRWRGLFLAVPDLLGCLGLAAAMRPPGSLNLSSYMPAGGRGPGRRPPMLPVRCFLHLSR